MSDNQKLNESVDRFSEYVRQRLTSHPIHPDEKCWDEIEVRLKPKRHFKPIWLGVPIAASIFVIIYISFQPFKGIEQERRVTITDAKVNPDKGSDIKEMNVIQKNIIKELPLMDITDKQSTILSVEDKTKVIEIEEKQTIPVISDNIKKENEQDTEEIDETENKSSQITKEKGPLMEKKHTAYNFHKKNNYSKNNWQISAGFGSGSFSSSFLAFSNNGYHNENSDYYDQNSFPGFGSGNWHEQGNENNNNHEESVKNIKHSLPLSFGLTVRKSLNKTWSIESGLIYTYLSSDFEIEGSSSYDASLNLHYLGLPINLIADTWKNKQWNVYISGGGTIEKGLRSVFKKKIYAGNNLFYSKQEKKISGLQWSLNGAIGISYNLYKDINMYIEPGISYYFDCNQPLSRRTEDPVNFNVRIGFRYNLK